MQRRTPAKLTFDCLAFTQSSHTLVLFACPARTLWDITQVNQREEDDRKGYQRAVSEARAEKIAQFIDADNLIPTSVLISFNHAKLSQDQKRIVVENRQDAGWVIDGQHRLAGGQKATKDLVLPVVAFTDLSLQDQINCFVTINKEQRGVSSSLYLELLKSLPGTRNPNEDAKQRAVDLAHQLKADEASPFYGRIVSTTSPKKGELSLTNFVRKLQPMLKIGTGRLHTFNDEERCKIINSYYKALQQTFPAEYENVNSVFFKTIGFGVLMGILPTFLDITIQAHGGFRVSHAIKTFKEISDYDFGDLRGLTGSGAESSISQDLRDRLLARARTGSEGTVIELD
jgi:DGQHR domain-containing protein